MNATTNAKKERDEASEVAPSPLRLQEPDAEGPPVSKFLIVIPRLEFCAIKTKQTPSSTSNRCKTRFSYPKYVREELAEKAPAGGQRYERQIQKSRPDVGARRETAELQTTKTRKKRRRSRVGRYVYDSGSADLGCGFRGSDYDVRSLRCALACSGCVLEVG
jgi:hypothetical protein